MRWFTAKGFHIFVWLYIHDSLNGKPGHAGPLHPKHFNPYRQQLAADKYYLANQHPT